MKKAIITWIGMMFLLIDTRIAIPIFYPKYIPFDTPAPETVSMIIDHLIGKCMHIDLFTDIVGFVLIMYVANKIVNENEKAFRAFALSLLSLILYVVNLGMPFFLNGEQRYVTGFGLYLAYILIKCLVSIQAGLMCCEMAETMENHAWNNVVGIFVILAGSVGFIRGLCFFYELPTVMWIYYFIQVFFSVVYTVMFWKRRNYWMTEEGGSEEGSSTEG